MPNDQIPPVIDQPEPHQPLEVPPPRPPDVPMPESPAPTNNRQKWVGIALMIVAIVVAIIGGVIVGRRNPAQLPKAPAASKTSVADDAAKFLAVPKAPETIVITQVTERIVEQAVVTTQVMERVVQTTVTNTVVVPANEYEFTQWVEHRTGTEVGTITNREGQVVQAKMKVDRKIISGGGTGPIQIFRPVMLEDSSSQPQTVVTTALATTRVNHSPTPATTGQCGSRQSYYINPFAKPTTGGEAFTIDPTRAKKR